VPRLEQLSWLTSPVPPPLSQPPLRSAGGRPAAEGNQPYPPLQSSCIGDSGGPLTFNVGKGGSARSNPNGAGAPADDRQVGIVSWVVGCGLEKIPAVYTNIPYWHKWIKWQLQAVRGVVVGRWSSMHVAGALSRGGGVEGVFMVFLHTRPHSSSL
jgi:hypothetical protein